MLDDMVLFVEVVKARSFRRAADALGMPNSTVSRRIRALEEAIGLRLLHRTTRMVEVTEAGQIYFERCKRIVAEARLAHEQLGEMLAQPTGLLRVSLSVDFATHFLAAHLPEFSRRYPGISVDFDLTPRRVDLVAEPFDLAIRLGELPDSTLIARKIAQTRLNLYASPDYLERSAELTGPADLARHECLCMYRKSTWTLETPSKRTVVAVGGSFTANSVGMIRRLALLDMGVALLAENLVKEDVAAGRLRRILPDWQAPPIGIYAVTETRLIPAKTQRFIEFVRECLKSTDSPLNDTITIQG